MCKSVVSWVSLVLVLALAGSVDVVRATDWTGAAGDGDWMNPGNWSPILPIAGERVDVESQSDLVWPILSGGTVSVGQVRIGYIREFVGELTVTGGATLNVVGELRLGRQESIPTPVGTLHISGDNTRINVSDRIECGRHGKGIIMMSGGTLHSDTELRLAYRFDGSAEVHLSGGTIDLSGNPGITAYANDGTPGTASIDITGGTIVLAGDQLALVEDFISEGIIVGFGGTKPVLLTYDPVTNSTLVTVESPGKAGDPSPGDGSFDNPRNVVLNWTAADSTPATKGHQIFFSTDMNDVRDGLGGTIQDASQFVPAQLLDYDTTYYWRVDEANEAGVWSPGDIWSFQIEPFARPISGDVITATAASSVADQGPENTINGIGLGDDDLHSGDVKEMWLSDVSEPNQAWIQYTFDKVYKLNSALVWNHNGQAEAFVGFGIKEALIEFSVDGTQWTPWGVTEFARGNITPITEVDLQGLVASAVRITARSNWGGLFQQYGLSEVRFLSIPVFARAPRPASGQTDVGPDVTLAWTDGREAAAHDVYVGTDPNDLLLVDTVSENAFATLPLDLQLDRTYYWKIDEVNEAEDPALWEGDVWSLTTADVIVVDNFESYRAETPEDPQAIFNVWADGFVDDTNGSVVGHATVPYPERATVRSGSQSLPLLYDNSTAPMSETTRTFASARDWTRSGVQGLVLYFYGDAENVPGQLYVKINNTKVLYDGDRETLQRVAWQKWYIPLADHLSNNELASVRSMSIGIDGGGAGMLLVDDISLTADGRVLMTPTEPTTDNLVAHYAFDGDASDSTGAHPGTLKGLAVFEAGKVGQAISLAGLLGDYVEITGYKGVLGANAITVTAWIKTSETDTGTIIAWGPGVPDGGRFGFRVNDNHIRCEFSGGNVQGTSVVNDGGWHHVAVTVKANATISYPEVTLWVDGLDDTQPSVDDTIVGILADPDRDVRIGSRPSAEDRWFGGLIDEVFLYDRALTAEEIAGAAGRVASFDQ